MQLYASARPSPYRLPSSWQQLFPEKNIQQSCLPSASAWTRQSGEARLIAPGTRVSPPRDSPAGRLLLSSPKHCCVLHQIRALSISFPPCRRSFSLFPALSDFASCLSPRSFSLSYVYFLFLPSASKPLILHGSVVMDHLAIHPCLSFSARIPDVN